MGEASIYSDPKSTCPDYACEWDGEGEHSHVGVQPHLRRVMDSHGRLIDGKTRQRIKEVAK